MKQQKLSKKLVLNKTTILNLNNKELTKAVGGVSGQDTTCWETMMVTCGAGSCDTYCLSIPNGPCYIRPCY